MSPATGAPARGDVVKPSAVSSASTRRRSGSGRTRWIFVERALDGPRVAVEPLPPRCDQSEDDDHRLVVGEHQRRQPVAGPHAIPPADASLALDRDAEILERGDVAAHRPRVDREPSGDLAARRQGARLEKLEQLEQPGGRRLHGSQSSTDRGRDLPYLRR